MSSTAVELWVALMVAAMVIYMVAYTLLRTSGDGRPWYVRLRHPIAGGERDGRAAPEVGAPQAEPGVETPAPEAGAPQAEHGTETPAPEPDQSTVREAASHSR